MKKKQILVTGGAGFIGSHIVKHHLENGHKVWAVDNLYSGKKENIEPFLNNPSFRFDEADVCTWEKLGEAVHWADRIFHMAAIVGQRLVLANPIKTLSNNILSCERILHEMTGAKRDVRLLITSTSSVYCYSKEDKDSTFHEDATLELPSGHLLQESYPLGKIVSEFMGLAYVHEQGLHCTIARIFNTIGLNQVSYYGMVVPTFIEQALSGQPITVYGTGHQSRSFTNVHDTVESLDLLLESPDSKGAIANVGDDRECSILDLAKLVLKVTGSKSEIRFIPYKEAYGIDFVDPQKRKPNLEMLRKLTGFHPKWTLEKTIIELVNHARAKKPQYAVK